MVKIIKYKKITIDHDIYIHVFSGKTVSRLTVYADDVINTTNNETSFPELRNFFEEAFEIKIQEVSVLKYLNSRIFHFPLGFSVDQTNHIMELVNEWLPAGILRDIDTPFSKYSTYEM